VPRTNPYLLNGVAWEARNGWLTTNIECRIDGDNLRAKADVLLSRQNLAASLTGATDPNSFQDPDRFAQTQAAVATAPALITRVLEREGLDWSIGRFLDASSVAPEANVDLLQFTVSDSDAALSERLATAYASEFITFRRELDTSALVKAKSDVHAKLVALSRSGAKDTPLYRSLLDKEQQLITLETLQTANAVLVHPAEGSEKVRPRPKRTALIALFLGLGLGLILAFVRDAVDTRLRSSREIEDELDLPVPGQIAETSRKVPRHERLVMLASPDSVEAEAFRIFRTNLEFANAETGAKLIMIASAMAEEGKTTTIANLGVALARDGRHVTLVDLDLRLPALPELLRVKPRHGITDVAIGRANLEDALITIPTSNASVEKLLSESNGRRGSRDGYPGLLELLGAGPKPPNVGEFVGTRRIADLLAKLRSRADIVLVDVPPILQVSDALNLSSSVDAVIVVTRLNVLDRGSLGELKRALDRVPTPKLGLVLTGVEPAAETRYGGYFAVDDAPEDEAAVAATARRFARFGRSR
jgi:Mrp family chromosome partitioning ATPase